MSVTLATGTASLVPQTMDQAVRLAEIMSRGKLIPEHIRNPADALMVIEQAMRWNMSPFAVAQATSSIHGKLMFEGKLVAAALHSSGALATRLAYDYEGAGDNRTVKVSATLAGETAPRELTIRYGDVKTSNEWWKKQPDQQLAYSGARNWARRFAPEVMLGVYSPEEMEPVVQGAYAGTTIEAKAEPAPVADSPKARTVREWLDEIEAAFEAAATGAEVDDIVGRPEVQKALDTFKNGARERLNAAMNKALNRTAPFYDDGSGAAEPAAA
jgi:hypothetical protein